ncbi:MAG: hypothetical protein ACLQNE_19540 [Thermoguttaceae bacterium]
MLFKDLVVLLPCPSLESLSLHRDSAEAEELLSAWSALYHPSLVAGAGSIPHWSSAETPPELTPESLVLVPKCSELSLPSDWLAGAASSGARIVCNFKSRQEIVTAVLERATAEGAPPSAVVAPSLVADFFALGFCHFQVELLTRQLRYSSNLDEERFRRQTVAAAEAAVGGDETAAREQLRGAFDRLTEAREYFYPVETYLLDLTLAATTTIGPSLRAELSSDRPVNLLISAKVIEEMAAREPASLAVLKEALEKGNVVLIGGEYDEADLPLLPVEDVLSELRRGLAVYDRYVSHRPTIFGRRRFGLTPLLPQLLRQLGFQGALHFTLDDGVFPTCDQSKIRWEGLDGTEIESLARIPMDVTQAEWFLRLSERLGHTADLDHAATAVFAHWPGQSSPWYGDLRRMAKYATTLGRFGAMTGYFQSTQYSGRSIRFTADKYRSPYLQQEVAAGRTDPISRWVAHYRRRALLDATQSLNCLADLIGRKEARVSSPAGTQGEEDRGPLENAVRRFAAALPRSKSELAGAALVTNPSGFTRRLVLDVSDWERLPDVGGPVIAAEESGGRKQALIDVPGMGFASIRPAAEPGSASAAPRKKVETLLAEDNVLRNEYFQAVVNRTTGAIQSITNYAVRGNRLAQQIGMRLSRPGRSASREPGSEDEYSIMAADEVTASPEGSMIGRIVSRGQLMDREGKLLARFVETIAARRGSRVLDVQIDLEADRQPDLDPWTSYYAARFAWVDETAELFQGVGLSRQPIEGSIVESPYYLDLRAPRTRLTILTAGLPYHRRFGLRKLDTLLSVRGETARSFRFAIGVDLVHPVHAALAVWAPESWVAERLPLPTSAVGWLFHIDARNVIATAWETVLHEGRIAGYRVRLLETEGRAARVSLRSFRTVARARQVNFLGEDACELPVADDCVTIEMNPRQWLQIEAEFIRS